MGAGMRSRSVSSKLQEPFLEGVASWVKSRFLRSGLGRRHPLSGLHADRHLEESTLRLRGLTWPPSEGSSYHPVSITQVGDVASTSHTEMGSRGLLVPSAKQAGDRLCDSKKGAAGVGLRISYLAGRAKL